MPNIFLHLDGQQLGPYSPEQVRQLLAEGKIFAATPAWYQELSEWGTVDAVLSNFPAPSSTPPPYRGPAVPPAASPRGPIFAPPAKGMNGCVIAAIIAAACVPIFAILAGIALGPINAGITKAKENMSMQSARAIDLAMFAYANDHNGIYPDGQTSTQVFQQLLDQKYMGDPGIFYVAMPGKTRATSHVLAPENVCYDVTSGVTTAASDFMPVVFLTGYSVSYAPRSVATPDSAVTRPFPGLAVAYKDNQALFLRAAPDGTIPDFIPAGFDPGTQTFRQLKP